MSFSPKPFGKNNPCPVCGKADIDCRYNADDIDFIQCHTFVDARKGERVNGFICVKESNGHTASFKPDNSTEWTEERRREWAQEQRRRRERSEREEQQKLAQLLPIPDRDEQYRRIVATLGLNQKHRISELSERRGLNSPEIDFAVSQGWLASWKPGVKVDVSSSLSGINGGQLTGVIGLAIAAVNPNGEITGFQIASDNRVKFGKYIWLSSAARGGNGPHLPSGELPVFVWRHPEAEQITETWLVEGGPKSMITALKLWLRHGRKDIQIIGAAGANWTGSINAVIDALGQTSKVVLCPDAGSLSNSGILSNYKKIVEALTSKAYSVSVAWWDQVEKGKDLDVDELDNTLGFDLITPGQFSLLAKEYQHGESINATERVIGYQTGDSRSHKSILQTGDDGTVQSNVTRSTDNSSRRVGEQVCTANNQIDVTENSRWWRDWLKSRTYTPDIVVNQSKFRFPQVPDKDVIVSVRSGLGTEKTWALIEQIRLSSNRAFLIGSLNNLLLQTGNRASEVGVKIHHLQYDDGISLVPDINSHIMLCLDSIHHIDGYFNGADIYLDEAVSVLLHAVTGGTLKEEQGRAIAIFSKALRECNRIFLLDGNLADIHVDFIAKIAGKKAIKIENQAKIPPHNFKFIIGINEDGEIKKRDKSPLIKALLGDDVRPWIASDSKNLTDGLDEILRQGGKHGYVLNKDTSGEPWAKEFLLNPGVFIENHKPDYSIISPTAQSGVSVTVRNHFTDKFTFFTGVLGTNSQHQILSRLRDDSITHYVFCPEKSTVRDRNNPKNYSEKAFSKLLDEKIIQSAILAADGNASSTMLEIIGEAIARSNDDWWQLSCQLGALDNFEMNNLRKCLIHALKEAGHNVEICEWDTDDEAKAKEKAAKEAVRKRYALELYQAIEFSSIDEASKAAKSSPSKEVQRRIEKTWLLDSLPGIKESSLWDAEFIADFYLKDREFISKQRRFYFLNNFEISKKRSEVKWYYMATNQNFFLAQAKGDSHLKIWGLQELNALQFLHGEYHRNSPALVEAINMVRERSDIALALNIVPKPETESKKENIEFLRSLLDSFGIKLAKPVRKLINGVRERVYCVDDPAMLSPARLEVLSAIARKFDNYLESEAVAKVVWEEVPVIEVIPAEAAGVIVGEVKDQPTQIIQEPLVNSQQSTVNNQQSSSESVEVITNDVINQIDQAIGKLLTVCNLSELPVTTLWQRRLDRALLLGQDIARQVYQSLPQQLLNDVWSKLTDGVQREYLNLFEAGYG
ncbi:MAG: plasmid replication protein, CyRepA1 family [Nostoc sp.]